jgi:hypothetical protein
MPAMHARNKRTGVARGVFYVDSHVPIAKQQLSKHIPANTQQYKISIARERMCFQCYGPTRGYITRSQ